MRLCSLALSVLLAASPALAQSAPLPAGKPAGVKPAINQTTEVYYLIGAAALASVLGLLLFKTSKSNSSASASTAP